KYYLNADKTKYLFLASLLLGVSIATKYNAAYLAFTFIPLFIMQIMKIQDRKRTVFLYLKAGFFIFLGFFICDPFFVVQAGKYLHNLMIYSEETKCYWNDGYFSFFPRHLVEISSFMYLNFMGVIILLFGAWGIFKKYKKLFIIIFFVILAYEVYFGIYLKNYSPLRYINPLIPIAALLFGSGVDFIFKCRKKLMPVLIVFFPLLTYNYLDIWHGMSFGPTHIQKARAFIEENIPEFTTICIISDNYIPQLNMTREAYDYLIRSAVQWDSVLMYKDMDGEKNYDSVFRKMRAESLMKRPQYNFVRWDNSVDTEEKAAEFLKKNSVKYIISKDSIIIGGKTLESTKIALFIKEFRPRNKRIYKAVFADVSLFLYEVN
ncbi:MAG: hypothetical protein KKD11_04640, partial [Candidatus Omnitrophica bacterium]|nr:hypothetical protein [Candidatus Omnitrophota bacterium]